MPDLTNVDLSGARLDHVDLHDADLRMVDFTNARVRDCDFHGVVMRGVELVDVDIDGDIRRLVVNGVDVVPLVEAALDARHPDRATMRADDPAGFREAWAVLERLWTGTVDRARRLEPALLHESVDDEWSFIETLRHLTFASDSWVRRAILGDPAPWHPLALPWDTMPDIPGVPRDREVHPSLDEVLAVRLDRMSMVRSFIDDLTDDTLAADTTAVEGPGWPESRSYPVKRCLRIVLNEEWEHRLFAERDLDALERRRTEVVEPE